MTTQAPVPPFTADSARAEDGVWRNRDESVTGREQTAQLLRRTGAREREHALRKDPWAFTGDRIAVRFQHERVDASGQWWRSHGDELWESTEPGLVLRREAGTNDVRIDAALDPRSAPGRGRRRRAADAVSAAMTSTFVPECRFRRP